MYARRLTLRLGTALITASLASICLGDGLALKGGRDISHWLPLVENEQLAAIHYADGVEKMILAINVDLEDETDQALWIVPVPGTPDDVRVSICSKFPRFFGFDLRRRASANISLNATLLRATQVYPLLFELCLLVPSLSTTRGIARHAEVEEYGLRCEVLTAESTDALCGHLLEQGVDVETKQLASLEPYFSGDHVLIAAWVSSREQLIRDFPGLDNHRPSADAWPCVMLEFPTERAFFPLRPTSAYGDVEVPLQLYVTGFVEPQTAAMLVDRMRIGYFHQEGKAARDTVRLLGAKLVNGFDYTSIRLAVEARLFTDDLWFVPTKRVSLRYASAVQRLFEWIAVLPLIVVWLLLSYVCAGLAGLAVFRRWKQPAKLGFWNMLTLVGLTAALHYRPLSQRFGSIEGLTEKQLQHRFVGYFSLIFVVFSILLQLALNAPLFLS